MSKYETNETVEEQITRLEKYYNNPKNGLNKSFLVMKIKSLKNKK